MNGIHYSRVRGILVNALISTDFCFNKIVIPLFSSEALLKLFLQFGSEESRDYKVHSLSPTWEPKEFILYF